MHRILATTFEKLRPKFEATFSYLQTKSGIAKPYPVMMYIHGGDFYSGSGNTFPGHIMAAFYDVVVVTFNYRLGALGTFLSVQ